LDRPHENVDIGRLIFVAGFAKSPVHGRTQIMHGKVKIEQWTIGISENYLPRWILRGVRITVGAESFDISEDGTKVLGRGQGIT
jgi:hypothetical protein